MNFLYDEKNSGLNIVVYTKFKMFVLEESRRRNSSIFDIFHSYDEQNIGSVNRNEMSKMFLKFFGNISNDDQRAVFNEISIDLSEKIYYEDFKSAILGAEIDVQSLLLSIKRIIRQKDVNIAGIMAQIDKNNSGSASFIEFGEFLDKIDMQLTQIEKEFLFDHIDIGNNRQIEFSELANEFDPTNFKAKKTIYVLMREFKMTLANSGENWKTIYERFQKTSLGGLPKINFSRFLNELGYRVSKYDSSELFNLLDSNENGFLTKQELQSLAKVSQGAKEKTFDDHGNIVNQKVTLNNL